MLECYLIRACVAQSVRALASHARGLWFESRRVHSMWQYKDLFWQLTFREIKARYNQSVLGYAWAILVPLLNLLVLSIVFSHLFKVPTGSIPYPIYLFVALVPWIFLTNSISAATGSIMSNASLITKVKLPREIIPFSAISAKMIDLLLTSLILIFFLILYQIRFHPSLIFVPLVFIIQLILMVGISLILSATNVFFRDVENVLGVFLTIWMYLTPVIYSPELIPADLKMLFYLNPMTGIIDAYRNTILFGTGPDWSSFAYSGTLAFVVLILGYIYFKTRDKFFGDVI